MNMMKKMRFLKLNNCYLRNTNHRGFILVPIYSSKHGANVHGIGGHLGTGGHLGIGGHLG